MMQNVINSAFETVVSIEEGVEVLESFIHLKSREVSVLSNLSRNVQTIFICSGAISVQYHVS